MALAQPVLPKTVRADELMRCTASRLTAQSGRNWDDDIHQPPPVKLTVRRNVDHVSTNRQIQVFSMPAALVGRELACAKSYGLPVIGQRRRRLAGVMKNQGEATPRFVTDRHQQHRWTGPDHEGIARPTSDLNAVWSFKAGVAAYREKGLRTGMNVQWCRRPGWKDGTQIFGGVSRGLFDRKRTNGGDTFAATGFPVGLLDCEQPDGAERFNDGT